jgi:tRNA (cmo5U34)-methyltransferase
MTDSAPATFDAHAADYDAPRRRLIPPFDAFYGTAVDALEMLGRPPRAWPLDTPTPSWS